MCVYIYVYRADKKECGAVVLTYRDIYSILLYYVIFTPLLYVFVVCVVFCGVCDS
jgi:hypothetical protein